jgi:hypothetical protein
MTPDVFYVKSIACVQIRPAHACRQSGRITTMMDVEGGRSLPDVFLNRSGPLFFVFVARAIRVFAIAGSTNCTTISMQGG